MQVDISYKKMIAKKINRMKFNDDKFPFGLHETLDGTID